MRCLWIFTLLLATTGFITGCGGGNSEPAPSNEGDASQESAEAPADDQLSTTTPADVVHDFLEAARTGNDKQVAQLLTPTARTEVGRIGLNVAPPASDTARFDVGKTQKLGEKVAHVASRWIEQPTPSSVPQESEMVWALRLTEEGWRVGGMAMVPFEGEPPLLLDYEKPAEVMQQYKMLKAEIARRKAAAEQETTLR